MSATGDARPTVAAFDVDGTLTTRDCVVPFMRRVTGARRIATRLGVRPDRALPTLVRRDRDRLKSLAAAAAFRGLSDESVRRQAEPFARHVHDHWLRPDVLDVFRRHGDDGHRRVLVSASFAVYLQPLAELIGADAVLATRLHVTDDGILSGALDGPNCRGPEKVRRLHEWLDRDLGGRGSVRVVAYGDSSGDRELLADADEAHWVGRAGAA